MFLFSVVLRRNLPMVFLWARHCSGDGQSWNPSISVNHRCCNKEIPQSGIGHARNAPPGFHAVRHNPRPQVPGTPHVGVCVKVRTLPTVSLHRDPIPGSVTGSEWRSLARIIHESHDFPYLLLFPGQLGKSEFPVCITGVIIGNPGPNILVAHFRM